ncbi:hypothetical protein K502DRAFT_369171, partial [Neoconidiobolus thromboides FSU 785]
MALDTFVNIAISLLVCVFGIAVAFYIISCRYKRAKERLEKTKRLEREENINRIIQMRRNDVTIQLSEIRIENNLKNKTKFKATVGEEERIILK